MPPAGAPDPVGPTQVQDGPAFGGPTQPGSPPGATAFGPGSPGGYGPGAPAYGAGAPSPYATPPPPFGAPVDPMAAAPPPYGGAPPYAAPTPMAPMGGWGGPPGTAYGGTAPAWQTSYAAGGGGTGSQATLALVLAIVGWVGCGCLTSLPAVLIARGELQAIERGLSPPGGKSTAEAAFWIAAINLGLTVLILVGYVFVGILAFATAAAGP